ncbi:alpha/beta fold hydrolase [Micromonospora zingiberis]|nr:alpha/beta hydrolase [Micromonospora zingiberis]
MPTVRTLSLERKVAIGVAALAVSSWAIGARTRFVGRRRRTAEFSTMPRVDGGVVEVDYRRSPDAEFGVIFCNGLGFPHEQWAWVREHLPESAACVGYNRPGHGLSSPLPEATLEEQFQIVDELRKYYLDGLPVVLVGHSLGGYLAAAYAESRGDAGLSHVVMIDPTVIADLQAIVGKLPHAWARQHLLLESVWAATGLNALRPIGAFHGLYPGEVSSSITEYHALPRTWITAYREYLTASTYPPVERLTVPLHVVTALKGTKAAKHRASQEQLLELSDRSWHHLYEEANHIGILAEQTHAKELAELIVPGSWI